MLTGALIGAVCGLVAAIFIFLSKEQRFNKILRSIQRPEMEYAALYHYASDKRYGKGMKIYDSYGVLYIIGSMVYYKTTEAIAPMEFNMKESKVQQEPDWRRLKWFSITTPSGEKHYFDSFKMGFFANNSDETLKGLAAIQAKAAS